jgi:hypothetical protein
LQVQRLQTGKTEVGQPVERLWPIGLWQQTWKRSFQASIKRLLARSWNVSSQWPNRQLADMPRPAINAFSLSARDAGLIPWSAQEVHR